MISSAALDDLMVDATRAKGVKLLPLQIPREVMEQQAADAGDVRFFELAWRPRSNG